MQNWSKKYRLLRSLPAVTETHYQVSKIHNYWIATKSLLITFNTCFFAITKSINGSKNRAWMDIHLQSWAKQFLDVIKVKTLVHNPHNTQMIEGQATIIMCNHSSAYDIPLSFQAFPKNSIRMLAKKELSHVPLFGQAMRYAEFPFIDRKNREQAIKDLTVAQKLMATGIMLWIAPEGTRSKSGQLNPFKKGAFITAIQAQATIIPIGIQGAHELLPTGTKKFNLNKTTKITIGTSISAAEYTLDNKEELMNRVYEQIKQLSCKEN